MFPTWDTTLLLQLQDWFLNPVSNRFFIIFTALGDNGYIWIALGLILLFFKKTRQSGLLLLISLLCTHILNTLVLKELVNRPRPYEVLANVKNLIGPQSESSFPSGHTATAFGSAFVIVLHSIKIEGQRQMPKWAGITALVTAILMGYSRLHVGVHYPIDVLVGALVGIFVATLVVYVAHRLSKRPRVLKK